MIESDSRYSDSDRPVAESVTWVAVWAIDTGGMPIVTNWTNLIILFELTMLSAIVTTVITLLITANIPSWKKPDLYDPLVSEGRILIGVTNPSNPSLIESTLQSSGGGVIKKLE